MTKKEIILLISGLEPYPFDKIFSNDKGEAYCKGYNDALEDMIRLIGKIHTKTAKNSDISFEWNETIQKLYGGSDD